MLSLKPGPNRVIDNLHEECAQMHARPSVNTACKFVVMHIKCRTGSSCELHEHVYNAVLLDIQADEPLATFLDYCTYGHMIDNVVLLVTGTLHERDVTVSPCNDQPSFRSC